MSKQIQIVATIGPATKEKEILKKIMEAGMSLARLNFSHGTHEEHGILINNIREASKELNLQIPIIQDLSGPRMTNDDGHEFDKSSLEVITKKDLEDLAFGIQQEVDYVALSYVGKALDVLRLQKEMDKLGKRIPVIAKIERRTAIENLDEIIDVANAIMIARGDMGNEIPFEQIPFVEKDILNKCKVAGKPVIVATQVLLSMTENPVPTRAEMTDIAFAVLHGADALMLSEETTVGKYPVEVVTMMRRGITEATSHMENIKINNL